MPTQACAALRPGLKNVGPLGLKTGCRIRQAREKSSRGAKILQDINEWREANAGFLCVLAVLTLRCDAFISLLGREDF